LEMSGVQPDIPYKICHEDIVKGFLPFVEAIHDTMDRLCGINEPQINN
jgi:hypothetical protein